MAVALCGVTACTVHVLSDDELQRLYEPDAAVVPATLNEGVNPVGYAADIDLERVDNTVRITSGDQLGEFVTALSTPWTRVLVDDAVTLTITATLRPAVGVKIYCPDGSFTIDAGALEVYAFLFDASHLYLANFILKVPLGDTSSSPNLVGGFDVEGPGADYVYLQNLTLEVPGAGAGVDAARGINVFNADGPAGRMTFDSVELETVGGSGFSSKGIHLGGGDSSTVAATVVHSVLASGEYGVKATDGAFIDYVNNVSPTVVRTHAIETNTNGAVRARGSYFQPKIQTVPGDEFFAQDGGMITFGPEENVAHPGVTLTPMGGEAPAAPYPTPSILGEDEVLGAAGAGKRRLPD